MTAIMRQVDDQPTTRRRTSVREAAEVLGITVEAVRGRIKRNTIPHGKAEDGGVYVWLETDQGGDQPQPDGAQGDDRTSGNPPLVKALRAEVAFMREEMQRRDERHAEEIRRRDHLLAAALERIPAIDPPQHAQDRRQNASEGPGGSEVYDTGTGPQRPPEEPLGSSQETETGPEEVHPLEADEDPQTEARQPWWLRWLGG